MRNMRVGTVLFMVAVFTVGLLIGYQRRAAAPVSPDQFLSAYGPVTRGSPYDGSCLRGLKRLVVVVRCYSDAGDGKRSYPLDTSLQDRMQVWMEAELRNAGIDCVPLVSSDKQARGVGAMLYCSVFCSKTSEQEEKDRVGAQRAEEEFGLDAPGEGEQGDFSAECSLSETAYVFRGRQVIKEWVVTWKPFLNHDKELKVESPEEANKEASDYIHDIGTEFLNDYLKANPKS